MTEPMEIEAKFELDPAHRNRLLAATTIGRFTASDRKEIVQDDVYYDTDDARLAAAGATLRIRRSASGAKMTFKGPRQAATSATDAHIASRLEDEVVLDAAQVSAVPHDGPLPELPDVSPFERARSLVGSAVLVPVANLHNQRVTVMLSAGATTLELAVDRCVGTRLRDGRTVSFDEVELESTAADHAAVMEASNALQQAVPGLRPSRATKLGRTLG